MMMMTIMIKRSDRFDFFQDAKFEYVLHDARKVNATFKAGRGQVKSKLSVIASCYQLFVLLVPSVVN